MIKLRPADDIFKLAFKQISEYTSMRAEDAFVKYDRLIHDFIEGDGNKEPEVVVAGRQPSLHR